MVDQLNLDFTGWTRSGIFSVIADPTLHDGRLRAAVDLTVRNTEPPNETVTETVHFDLLGPGDVLGLKPVAVTHMVPSPGTIDFEETKCAYVEVAATDVPWRYTPQLAVGATLQPWLVLVTAKTSEAVLNAGGTVTLAAGALSRHDLAHAARWAHGQDDHDHPGSHRATRILSPRDLDAETDYLAVVVPAFTAAGQTSWNVGDASVTLPVFHSWTFKTAEAGDFPTLASRLQGAVADETLGRAPMEYTPVPGPDLSVRGALAPIGGTDVAVSQPVDDDVFVLTTPVVDPRRPVVGLPVYGDAWVDDPAGTTTWGATFRHDPRPRAVGGIGLMTGIAEQDVLSAAAAAQAGALAAAAQRIRNLVTGLTAARSLWRRRLPADPMRRVAVFGPALARVMTASGTVLGRATDGDRPLPAALFSTAARRILRPGPARSRRTAKGAADPGAVIVAANTCPPLPDRAPKGLAHADAVSDVFGVEPLDKLLDRAVSEGRVPFEQLERLVKGFDRSRYSDNTVKIFDSIMAHWLEVAREGGPLPVFDLLAILDPPGEPPDEKQLIELLRRLDANRQDRSLIDLATTLQTKPPKRPCNPVDLDALAAGVTSAIDPTVARPFVVDRVFATIDGLDDQPLTPPELCPDLDIPAWQLLRDHAPDWLLPGAEKLADDSVVAVETNPRFVDAFLLGLNTQTIGELRFRNIPIVTGCTPLRQFWARTNPATETYDDDIVGVRNWPAATALGAIEHQTPAAASADLVVVFKTPLFRRYPRTIVYLTPAPLVGGDPDWDAEPDFAARLVPSFQGSITPDITFFGFDLDPMLGARYWVVLEEPPHGFQFFNQPMPGFDAARVAAFNNATDGGAFANAAFADPYRVMIRGEALIPEPA